MAQINISEISKTTLNKIFSILNDKELYSKNLVFSKFNKIMDLFKDPEIKLSDMIYIKRVEKGKRTYYLYFDQLDEWLTVIRDDEKGLEQKVQLLLDRIISTIKEYFNITGELVASWDVWGLKVYTKGSKLSELEGKASAKQVRVQNKNFGFWAEVRADKNLGFMVLINDKTLNYLLWEYVLKDYKNLNEYLPA